MNAKKRGGAGRGQGRKPQSESGPRVQFSATIDPDVANGINTALADGESRGRFADVAFKREIKRRFK